MSTKALNSPHQGRVFLERPDEQGIYNLACSFRPDDAGPPTPLSPLLSSQRADIVRVASTLQKGPISQMPESMHE
jgi:hypothetical protein